MKVEPINKVVVQPVQRGTTSRRPGESKAMLKLAQQLKVIDYLRAHLKELTEKRLSFDEVAISCSRVLEFKVTGSNIKHVASQADIDWPRRQHGHGGKRVLSPSFSALIKQVKAILDQLGVSPTHEFNRLTERLLAQESDNANESS